MIDLAVAWKIAGVAFAIGLDVFAVSIAIGITGIPWRARIRMGIAFSIAELSMQVIGYLLGTGFGRAVGEVAPYVGFAALAGVGVYMVRESLAGGDEPLKVDTGLGLLTASLSISLDSLGVGFALPGVPLPVIPLLSTVAVSTILFTFSGLAFGARLGERLEKGAELLAGCVLIALALLFTVQHVLTEHR